MTSYLCINIRFFQPHFHGRNEYGDREWPPSPLRLTQALIAGSAGRWNEPSTLKHAVAAFRWLESLPPPRIIAPKVEATENPYRLYVPDNVADKVAAAWSRGRDATIADYRTEKDVLPVYLEGDTVHYLFSLDASPVGWRESVDILSVAVRSITRLGWGIDMATGDAHVITAEQEAVLPGLRWKPSPLGSTRLRSPKAGTLDDLMRRHSDFLGRLTDDGFRPVPPLRVFDIVGYHCEGQPLHRPYRVFELRNSDGSRFRYPPRKLIHIAAMVRHLAVEAMKKAPPRGVDENWVEMYVAGHAVEGSQNHRQLSYLPLPSIGHEHVDPGVRRVMIMAPVGDEAWLDHVARRLAGQVLQPLHGDEFDSREPPLLVPVRSDSIARFYIHASSVWNSFTPVILPGHDDHKAAKTKTLIERALRQSGIDQPCDFEWSPFSRFPKSYSAHKCDKDKRPQGYVRPSYLNSQTAVHLTLRFHDGSRNKKPVAVPGPITVGAGRHCGLGLFAAIDFSGQQG